MVYRRCRSGSFRTVTRSVGKGISDTGIIPVFLSEDIHYGKRESIIATTDVTVTFSSGHGGISITAAYNGVK